MPAGCGAWAPPERAHLSLTLSEKDVTPTRQFETDAQADAYAQQCAEIDRREVRWNVEGSLQGHYCRPERRSEPPLLTRRATRTLYLDWHAHYPQSTVDLSAFGQDVIDETWSELNDERDDQFQYNQEQVMLALWRFLDREIDDLLEDIEARFLAYRKRDELLGHPRIDHTVEERYIKGDRDFDAHLEAMYEDRVSGDQS